MAKKHITRQIHSDYQKLRRFALQLLVAGDLRRYIAKILGQKRVVFFRYELCIERPVNGEFEGLSIGMVYDQNPII